MFFLSVYVCVFVRAYVVLEVCVCVCVCVESSYFRTSDLEAFSLPIRSLSREGG